VPIISIVEWQLDKRRNSMPTGMIFFQRAPVSSWQQTLVVSRFPIDIVGKHWNHAFLGLFPSVVYLRGNFMKLYLVIEMVNLIAFVEDIAHHFGRGRVYDGGRDYIGHISMILVLGYFQLGIGVELTNGCKMHIAPVQVSE
jgi:hypothetical protein